MIFAHPKTNLSPVAYQADPSGATAWTHLQILGGRQLVAFDADGDVILTIDLALTSDVKILRQTNIDEARVAGSTVHTIVRRPAAPAKPPCCTDATTPCVRQYRGDCQYEMAASAQGDGDGGDDDDGYDY